jgi:hypothetical protein
VFLRSVVEGLVDGGRLVGWKADADGVRGGGVGKVEAGGKLRFVTSFLAYFEFYVVWYCTTSPQINTFL